MRRFESDTGNFAVRDSHGSIHSGLYLNLFQDKRDSGALNKVLQAKAKFLSFYRRQANDSWLVGI